MHAPSYKLLLHGKVMSTVKGAAMEKKVALVTGASRGIGRQISLTLAKEGMFVIVNYCGSEARAQGVLEEIRDNYPKYVVSLDEFDRGRNGIRHRNIRDFLLEKSWT